MFCGLAQAPVRAKKSCRPNSSTPTAEIRAKTSATIGLYLSTSSLDTSCHIGSRPALPEVKCRPTAALNSPMVHPGLAKKLGDRTRMHFGHSNSPLSIDSRTLSPIFNEYSSYPGSPGDW